MNNKINVDLAHQYIIANLVVRTLERDLLHMSKLKTSSVLEKFYQQLIVTANKELYDIKLTMRKEGLRAVGEAKVDAEVTVYSFAQRGLNEDLRYIGYALRNQVLKEVERLMAK